MTDLINWDEPIETVDGEPCEVIAASEVDLGDEGAIVKFLWDSGYSAAEIDAVDSAAIERARVIRAAAPSLRRVA